MKRQYYYILGAFLLLIIVSRKVRYQVMKALGLLGWRQLALELLKYTETSGTKKAVLTAYWDYKQWSVGYGSYAGSKDKASLPPLHKISQSKADGLLLEQLNKFAKDYVLPYTKGWKMHQIAAMVSLAYNIPEAARRIIGMVNAGEKESAIQSKLNEFVRAGGVVNSNLVWRRKKEWEAYKGATFYL